MINTQPQQQAGIHTEVVKRQSHCPVGQSASTQLARRLPLAVWKAFQEELPGSSEGHEGTRQSQPTQWPGSWCLQRAVDPL